MDFTEGTGLVDKVDGLVGEEAVADVLGTHADGVLENLIGITDMVVRLVFRPQPLEDAHGLLLRRFLDVNLLEAPDNTLAA